jgi:hypothetical protein
MAHDARRSGFGKDVRLVVDSRREFPACAETRIECFVPKRGTGKFYNEKAIEDGMRGDATRRLGTREPLRRGFQRRWNRLLPGRKCLSQHDAMTELEGSQWEARPSSRGKCRRGGVGWRARQGFCPLRAEVSGSFRSSGASRRGG